MCLKEGYACDEPKTIHMGDGCSIVNVCEGCFLRWAPKDFGITSSPVSQSDLPDDPEEAGGKPKGWRFGLDEPVF